MVNNQVMVSKEFVEAVRAVCKHLGVPKCHELNHKAGEFHDIGDICHAELRMMKALSVIERELY